MDAVSRLESDESKELSQLLSCLPSETIDYAFAYGSGAFPQRNQLATSLNMADFVVAVSSAQQFHRANLHTNRKHYSFMRYLGAATNANLQRNYAARVYCNTMVKGPSGRLFKYSVIDTDQLISDLLDWDSLYVSGRLHKPTLPLLDSGNEQLHEALDVNLRSAVHAALLLLPETFTIEQFYLKIASLSYTGDVRVGVAEDRNKISNIVKANMQRFDMLYAAHLADGERVAVNGFRVEQDVSAVGAYHHLNLLPRAVLWRLQDMVNRRQKWNRDLEEVVFTLAHRTDYATDVETAIRSVVWHSSWTQSLKNVITAGPWKSSVYGLRKFVKMLRSR